jgi:hypothetical protein
MDSGMNTTDPPPDGAGLLGRLREALVTYVVFPSDEATDAVVLWIAATHAQECWEHATRLVVKSPEKRCGKSRLLEIIRETVRRPVTSVNISAAALVRSITTNDPPTLLVDEADRLYGSKVKSELNEDLTGILNSGFARDWPYIRYNAAKGIPESFPTYCMAAMASKKVDLPDTIEDRAVMIVMRRRKSGEYVAQYRRRNAPPLRELRDQLHDWVAENRDTLAKSEPDLPVEDRAADVWEPLVSIADAAGAEWGKRARDACHALSEEAGANDSESSLNLKLLRDMRSIFDTDGAPALWTETVIARLVALPESPWHNLHGRFVDARDIANLIKGYGVHPKDVRQGGGANRKGYHRDQLHDAWERYLPPKGDGRDTRDTSDIAGQLCRGGGTTIRDRRDNPNPVAGVADTDNASATALTRQVVDVAPVADNLSQPT